MREQKKTMGKGIFIKLESAQCCHHLGYENAFFWGEGGGACFSQFFENAVNRGLK